jgi:hypothetical protein
MRHSGNISDLVIWAAIGFGAGVLFLFRGFKNLKLKQLIEAIPTSKIRSMPMGVVEVVGKAVKTHDMNTPFSNMPCVFFQYRIEERRGSGKHARWVTVQHYTSPFPFKIMDETGSVSVNPAGAMVELKSQNVFGNSFFGSLPPSAKMFMDRNGIDYTGFLGFTKTMRLTEYYICPNQDVYVLGCAKHPGQKLESTPQYSTKLEKKKEMTMELLRKLKKSKLLYEKYDLNKDGTIDASEWEKARNDAALWVSEKLDKDPPPQLENVEVEIGRGGDDQMYYITDRSQRELSSVMFWKSTASIFGGAALALLSAAFLIYYFVAQPFSF